MPAVDYYSLLGVPRDADDAAHGAVEALSARAPEPAACLASDDVALAVLPMFHIYGMITILHYSMVRGSTLVTLPQFEPESFLKTIARSGAPREL